MSTAYERGMEYLDRRRRLASTLECSEISVEHYAMLLLDLLHEHMRANAHIGITYKDGQEFTLQSSLSSKKPRLKLVND